MCKPCYSNWSMIANCRRCFSNFGLKDWETQLVNVGRSKHQNFLLLEPQVRLYVPPPQGDIHAKGEGCSSENLPGGTQQSFIWGGSAPRSKPLPFYIPFLTEKEPLSYTFLPSFHILFQNSNKFRFRPIRHWIGFPFFASKGINPFTYYFRY